MLHVTCDLCGKELRPGDDQRYVVKVEVFATHDPAEITEEDLDEDHMEAVSQLLREMDENGCDELEDAHQNFRYDLCAGCLWSSGALTAAVKDRMPFPCLRRLHLCAVAGAVAPGQREPFPAVHVVRIPDRRAVPL
jgi:hypothetical protein